MRLAYFHVAAVIVILAGCGDSDGTGSAGGGGSQASGGGAAQGGGGASEPSGWAVSYDGPVSGQIGGSVTVVQTQMTSMASVSLAGDASGSDESLTVSYSYPASDDGLGAHSLLQFSMTLADGSSCSHDPLNDIEVTANVTDADQDTYAADFTGSVGCDEGIVNVEGYFRK